MKRASLILLCLFSVSAVSAFAQTERKPEIFLGYSNLQAKGLPDTNNLTGLFGSDFFNNRTTLHGFSAEATPFLKDSFGITGKCSFNENRRSDTFSFGNDSLKTDIFYFMGGPTVTLGHS